jgi:hypothetical protein
VQVRSILSYGCESWGPDALSLLFGARKPPGFRPDRRNLAEGPFERSLVDPAVKLQITCMRAVACAQRPTQRLLFAEMGLLPMHYHWFRRICGFWDSIVKCHESIAYYALLEEVSYTMSSDPLISSWVHTLGWAGQFLGVCTALGVDVWEGVPDDAITALSRAEWLLQRPLPAAHLCSRFREVLMGAWDVPRLDPSPAEFPDERSAEKMCPGIKMCRYKHWMGLPFHGSAPCMAPSHAHVHIPRKLHVTLIRFRLCCWPLRANRPVEGGVHLARNQRTCLVCKGSEPEHEEHVLLRCPAYAELRSGVGLPTEGSMLDVMRTFDQSKLAGLLSAIWDARNAVVQFGR